MNLLTVNSAKIIHSNIENTSYYLAIQYFQPNTISGKNLCPYASKECIATCLFTSGRMIFSNVQKCMEERTKLFLTDRKAYKGQLYQEIGNHVRRAKKRDSIPCIRLNGTSDIMWERLMPELFDFFHMVQFYDYTKFPVNLRNNLPNNYYLIRSHSESNHSQLKEMLQVSNVAIVFNVKRGEPLPSQYLGYHVIDGDITDLRFLEGTGFIVGLRAKGKARKLMPRSDGFVIDTFQNMKGEIVCI